MSMSQYVGKALLGMPGSEILTVPQWAANEHEDWVAGSPVYVFQLRTGDGREVTMFKSARSLERDTLPST